MRRCSRSSAILATWVNRQILDNGSFETTSTRLVRDPAIQSALSTYLVNEAYDNVDIPAALAERLPPNLKPLAAPLAAAVRQPATNAVNRLLTRPRVQDLFVNATTGTHRQLVAVVEDKTGDVTSTANGNVTMDLGVLVQQIGPSLGLPASALDRLPPNTGVITVMRSDQLGWCRTASRRSGSSAPGSCVLILALFAAAIYLAAGSRRETLRTVGWAFVFVGLLVLAVRRFAGSYTVDALAAPAYRDAGNHAWLISSSILGEVGRAIVLYGLVGVLGAVLAGPSRLARRDAAVGSRRSSTSGPTSRGAARRSASSCSCSGAAPTRFAPGGGSCCSAACSHSGIVALRRQTLREFPEPRPKPGGDATPSVGARAAAALRPKPTATQRRRKPPTSLDWPRCTTAAR